MCECGCSGNGRRFKFPGPKGIVYVLQVYEGCKGCRGPIGVDVHRCQGKEEKEQANEYPSLEFIGSRDEARSSIAIVDLEEAERALSAFALNEARDGVRDKIGADIFAEEAVPVVMRAAMDAAEKLGQS